MTGTGLVAEPRPAKQKPTMPYQATVDRFRAALITHALTAHAGNRTRAARALGLQRTYLVRLIKLFRIDVSARGKNPNGTRDC